MSVKNLKLDIDSHVPFKKENDSIIQNMNMGGDAGILCNVDLYFC